VRSFRSRIDGSVQPYGLVVPPAPAGSAPYRLDIWFHGRGETLSEVNFLAGRLKDPGQFTPPGAIVLHVYNRYCNAARFAGETDVFEAIDHVKRFYPIDPDRVVVRGFSMGGASCWGFATHHAWMWAAAAPGAGFSETADFLKVFQNETLRPPPWEQTLWRLYDATEHAANLFNVPVVAYSGEIDRQKQAADLMEKAMAGEGLSLTHIIGPATAHKYEPDAKARVDAELDEKERTLRATTKGVTALSFVFDQGRVPFEGKPPVAIVLDGQILAAPRAGSGERVWRFRKTGTTWAAALPADPSTLAKRHGLQGPIDDAFMDSFLFVRPTGTALHTNVAGWVAGEMTRAIGEWRRQFRGDARVSEPHESEALRGDQQRVHVARVRPPQQCAPDAEAARLGRGRHPDPRHAPRTRRHRRRRVLRGAVGSPCIRRPLARRGEPPRPTPALHGIRGRAGPPGRPLGRFP